jgi:hypothetical protein
VTKSRPPGGCNLRLLCCAPADQRAWVSRSWSAVGRASARRRRLHRRSEYRLACTAAGNVPSGYGRPCSRPLSVDLPDPYDTWHQQYRIIRNSLGCTDNRHADGRCRPVHPRRHHIRLLCSSSPTVSAAANRRRGELSMAQRLPHQVERKPGRDRGNVKAVPRPPSPVTVDGATSSRVSLARYL